MPCLCLFPVCSALGLCSSHSLLVFVSVLALTSISARSVELTPALVSMHLHQFTETLFQRGVCALSFVVQSLQAKRSVSEKSSYLRLVTDAALDAHVRTAYFEIRAGLFVRRTLNNPLIDRFRTVLVQHFASTLGTTLKKGEVFALLADRVPDAAPSEADYNRIMKELCVYTAGAWGLKSGEYDD
jgi:hypothetical protein